MTVNSLCRTNAKIVLTEKQEIFFQILISFFNWHLQNAQKYNKYFQRHLKQSPAITEPITRQL